MALSAFIPGLSHVFTGSMILLQLTIAILAVVLGAGMLIMFTPVRLVGVLPKRVQRVQAKAVNGLWHCVKLSTQGPVFQLIIRLGKKHGQGKLSSKCQTPNFKVKAMGCAEVEVTITPKLANWNPFHEENYFISWRRSSDKYSAWRSREYNAEAECEKVEKCPGRLKTLMDELPEHKELEVRISAVNAWGQSSWSKELSVSTMARPNDIGGFIGPLGPAKLPDTYYTWGQTQTEVQLKIPVAQEIAAKDIRFKCTGPRVDINLSDEAAYGRKKTELLSGPLAHRVKADEIFWTIEEEDKTCGKHLFVQMIKADGLKRWGRLMDIDYHPEIDTKILNFFADDMHNIGALGNMANLR